MSRKTPRGRAPRDVPGTDVALVAGREKPVKNRHPWIFSGAIDSIGKDVPDGGVADVVSGAGEFLARGLVNRKSQIVVRLLTWMRDEAIDSAFFRRRLERAALSRKEAAAARIVNAESDGLPGLVVDRYGGCWVLQVTSLGMDRRKADIAACIRQIGDPASIYERSEGEGREKEGLEESAGLLSGVEPPELVSVSERTWNGGAVGLLIDVRHGHKTGAYLDQADNRRIVGSLSNGAEVLNLFSYTGAFSLHAAAGGARRILNVDSSADALALSERSAAENGFSDRVDHSRADVFDCIRAFRSEGRQFDVVIADPPKFAHSAGQVERAARGYKDLNRIAMDLVRPGGCLVTFSCSGLVSSDLFQKIVWSASMESKREAQIVRRLSQAADHPVSLSFPEGEYLKGFVCRIF
jgi:23S rRNA (cytosine1962-C5)-methyltransferase